MIKYSLTILVICMMSLVACKAKPQTQATSLDPDPKWNECQSDSDCSISFGPRGEWAAVNMKFKTEQQTWARLRGAAESVPVNKSPEPTVGCRKNKCVTLP